MVPLEPFEIEVLRRLTAGVLTPSVLNAAIQNGAPLKYDYTNYGYYLSFRHPGLPAQRIDCNEPMLIAECEGVDCAGVAASFVVFLEDHELTLECFPLGGDPPIPPDFRSQPVSIRGG